MLLSIKLILGAVLFGMVFLVIGSLNYPSLIRRLRVGTQLSCKKLSISFVGCSMAFLGIQAIIPLEGSTELNGISAMLLPPFGFICAVSMALFAGHWRASMDHLVALFSSHADSKFRSNAQDQVKQILGPSQILLIESPRSMETSGSHPASLLEALLAGPVAPCEYHYGGMHIYGRSADDWQGTARELMQTAQTIVFSSANDSPGVQWERRCALDTPAFARKAFILELRDGCTDPTLSSLASGMATDLSQVRRLPVFPVSVRWAMQYFACALCMHTLLWIIGTG